MAKLVNDPSLYPQAGFFLALLGMVLNQSLGYFAAETTTATNMALIISLVPLISMFLSVPLLGQRLLPLAIVGAVLSLAGLVLMLSMVISVIWRRKVLRWATPCCCWRRLFMRCIVFC